MIAGMSISVLLKRLRSMAPPDTHAIQRKVAVIAGVPRGVPDRLVQSLLRDRFIVLIDHTRTKQDAEATAERLRSSFDVAVAL